MGGRGRDSVSVWWRRRGPRAPGSGRGQLAGGTRVDALGRRGGRCSAGSSALHRTRAPQGHRGRRGAAPAARCSKSNARGGAWAPPPRPPCSPMHAMVSPLAILGEAACRRATGPGRSWGAVVGEGEEETAAAKQGQHEGGLGEAQARSKRPCPGCTARRRAQRGGGAAATCWVAQCSGGRLSHKLRTRCTSPFLPHRDANPPSGPAVSFAALRRTLLPSLLRAL